MEIYIISELSTTWKFKETEPNETFVRVTIPPGWPVFLHKDMRPRGDVREMGHEMWKWEEGWVSWPLEGVGEAERAGRAPGPLLLGKLRALRRAN